MLFYVKGFKRHLQHFKFVNWWIGGFVFFDVTNRLIFMKKQSEIFTNLLTNLGMSLVCLLVIVFVVKTIWTVQNISGNSWKFVLFFVKTSVEQLISCKKWTQFWQSWQTNQQNNEFYHLPRSTKWLTMLFSSAVSNFHSFHWFM